MNLRERCQIVFQAGYELGQNSFRTLAQKTNLSKSSIHRLYHRIIKRTQHPESSLWESSERAGVASSIGFSYYFYFCPSRRYWL